ncbi:MAG: hypothetical protein Q9183_006552 [Haloplaca sp. 2 TL-2023]
MKDPIANMKTSPLFWDSEAAAGQDNPHEAHQTDDRPSAMAPVHPQGYPQDMPKLSVNPDHPTFQMSPPDKGTKDLPPLPTADVKPSPPDRNNTFGSIQDKDRESGLPSNSDERPKHRLRLSFLSGKRKDPTPATEPVGHVAKSFSDAPIVPQQRLPSSVSQGLPHPTANQINTETAISTETTSDTSSRLDSLSLKDESSNTDTDQTELSPDFNNTMSHTIRDNRSITSSTRSRTSAEIRSGTYPKRPVLPTTVTVITAKKDSPIGTEDLLPSEANKFSGFCRGAWRLQIGDAKRAMDDRQRPGSTYGSIKYWQCAQCTFQGRLIQIDKKTKGYDRQIMLADGIQFRWAFLFKSHVECQGAVPRNPLKCMFGCIFCCADGRGTPVFEGAQALMDHLQEHRMRLPEGEVVMRMNCVVGDKAEVGEDFDINLIAKEGRPNEFLT